MSMGETEARPDPLIQRAGAVSTRAAESRSEAAREETGPPEAASGVTPRLVLLALTLQVAVIFWVVRSEVTARVFVSSWSLPMPGVLALLLLLLVNRARRHRFSRCDRQNSHSPHVQPSQGMPTRSPTAN